MQLSLGINLSILIICYRKNYIFCGASNFEPTERAMSNNGILEIHEKKDKEATWSDFSCYV